MPRFVILRHEMPSDAERGLHWDLMLDWGESLRTWSLAQEPRPAATVEAQQLPDHRRSYLDYEGLVSGGRGVVSRWDSGEYVIEQDSPTTLQVILHGTVLSCRVKLTARSPSSHHWAVTFSP